MTRARLFSQNGGGANATGTIATILPSLTTANVTELTNLYFSNARVLANIRLASINELYDVDTTGRANGSALIWTGNIWAAGNVNAIANLSLSNTDSLVEGVTNKYFTNARARTSLTAGDPTIIIDWGAGTIKANVSAISNQANTSDAITEGIQNLFYTNARVALYLEQQYPLSGLTDVTYFPFTSANITDGYVLSWDAVNNTWRPNVSVSGRAYSAAIADEANTVLQIGNFTTDDLVEGANNKYLTVSLLNDLLANVSIDKLLDVNTQSNLSVNKVLGWNGSTWVPQSVSDLANVLATVSTASSFANLASFANTSGIANVALLANRANTATFSTTANTANTVLTIANFTTANLTEAVNLNLYYTNARVISAVNPRLTTANVIEISSNLYYTNARAVTTITPLLTTANVIEISSNLYFTNTRVLDALATANVLVDTLTVTNNLIVAGNTAIFAVGNVQFESKIITVNSDGQTLSSAEGAGFVISGANLRLTYGQLTDALTVNKNITVRGNILPSTSGVYNLGSPTQKFLSLYLGTQTIFLGNVTLGESASGGLEVKTATGDPSDASFANISATESILINRVSGNTFPLIENPALFGGNVSQFTSNTTGNIYFGIKKNDDWAKFAGVRVVETRINSGNVRSDVIIYNDREGVNDSVARISILGDGNVNILGNIYLQSESKFYGNVKGDLIGNVIGTVSTIFNHTTDSLQEGTNLYYTNSRVLVGVTTGNIQGNILVTGTINSNNLVINSNAIVFGHFTARANGSLTLGTPRLGVLVSNAISMTTETTVADGISQLNQILGKLVPASPPPLSTATGNLSIIGVSSYRICNFTQTINGPTATQAAAGSTVANVLRSNTWVSTWINDVGPGDTGTVTVYLNGAAMGSRVLGTGSDNGTYSNLTIADNVDYGTKTGQSTGFWESMDLRANATTSSPGWNEVYIVHSQAGQSNTAIWYNDINNAGTPTLTGNIFGPTSNSLTYSSTVPHYNSSTAWNIRVNVNKLSGDFYYSSDTFITGSAGGAFATPTSITYTNAGITTPLIQNLYRDSGNIQVSTAVNITSGFGRTLGTGPSLTVQNGYTSGSASIVPIGNVLYKTGTSSAMEETAITVGSAFGTGSTTVSRIENPGDGNNPVHTAGATLFNSTSSTLQPYDATTVGATLKHDTTNYSVGYWPAGPNLTTQSNVQYFTFRAVRTSLSKFNIKYTGNVSGMWCSMPGSVIDTSSTANGWLDMSIAYAGAGVPGAGAGGNGSQGCSLGGTVSLNTQVSASSKTCTFGTVSTSSTATNEVYVRIRLTPGQSITALSLETASN